MIYEIAVYQGNIYYRYRDVNDTTVYMDETVAFFDNEEDAKIFTDAIEDITSLMRRDNDEFNYGLAEMAYKAICSVASDMEE